VIRVLVVDDHPVVRDGLRGVLDAEPDMQVVGEAAHGAEALARIPDAAPDVVLMDLRMPVMGGVEAIAALRAAAPGVRVLVLTTFDTDRDVLPAVEGGRHRLPAQGHPARRAAARGTRGPPRRGGALTPPSRAA
jgi:DNA-binding NarL/FixJ family response regulator